MKTYLIYGKKYSAWKHLAYGEELKSEANFQEVWGKHTAETRKDVLD